MEKPLNGGELSMTERRTTNGTEVVLTMPYESKDLKGSSSKDTDTSVIKQSVVNSPSRASTDSTAELPRTNPMSCPSPEIGQFSPSPNKPPKPPSTNGALARRKTLTRSAYSKPKSRFGEQPYPVDASMLEEENSSREQFDSSSPYRGSINRGSPINKSATVSRTVSITTKTPLMASPGHAGAIDDEEEIYKKVTLELSKAKHNKMKTKVLVEWIVFSVIIICLIACLTIDSLRKSSLWGLEAWKWCVLVMVIFSGLLITNWVMHFIVFLIERNFLLRKKVLYFVHGLKKSVQVFTWLALVLLTWVLLFGRNVERSEVSENILHYVSRTIITILIGSFLWFLKTLVLKILASSFHVNTFFDRIQESIFHHYVLQTLSAPPLIGDGGKIGRITSTGQLSFRSLKKKKASKGKKVIDMGKIHRMKQEKVSAWTMKMLVDAVTNSGLTTISNTLDESCDDEAGEQERIDKEITNEMEAMVAAYRIFKNVAKPGQKYIEEDDLLKFMIKEEVDLFFPLIEGAETGKIDMAALTVWVVKVYQGRRALAHALTDTKTAVKQLNKLVTGILVPVTAIIWLLLIGIATTKVLVVLSSQLVALAFMFGNTCKTILEAIIFVFVMHPFDVGDRCVIDGVQLLVEEMNILSTVFLKLDCEKVYYPNSVLLTKAISNYRRSPDMGDKVEFSIDFMTPLERIATLKERVKQFLDKNPQHWYPTYNVFVSEIENINKIKIGLYVTHTMNFQDFAEKNRRRTELMIELKRIFEDLKIKYNLLPQEVHLCQKDLEKKEQ